MIIKNVKHVELHTKIVSAALNIQTFKMIYYYTNVEQMFKQAICFNKLICFNKFILMLQKGGYLYEYLDDCKRFDETSSPKKRRFFCTASRCI